MTDKYNRHELLDRTFILSHMVEQYLIRGYMTAEERKLLDQVGDALGQLYQLIGHNNAVMKEEAEEAECLDAIAALERAEMEDD